MLRRGASFAGESERPGVPRQRPVPGRLRAPCSAPAAGCRSSCGHRPAIGARRRIRVERHPVAPKSAYLRAPTRNWPHRRSRCLGVGCLDTRIAGRPTTAPRPGPGPQGQPQKYPTPLHGHARARCDSRRSIGLRARWTARSRASGSGARARSGRRPRRGRARPSAGRRGGCQDSPNRGSASAPARDEQQQRCAWRF